MPIRCASALVLLCLALLPAAELELGVNSDPEAPWVLPGGGGLSQRLIAAAAARVGVEVRFVPLPWQRALGRLEAGQLAGVVNASCTPEREAFARYPRDAAGTVDAGCRLHRERYVLLRRRGDVLDWDGKAFHGLAGLVCAQREYSIVAILRARGVEVDDQAPDLLGNLDKLATGRAQGAALPAGAAAAALREHARLDGAVETVAAPLAVRDYHLILARDLDRHHPGVAESLWRTIGELRAGPDYAAWCAAAGAAVE